MFDCIYEPIAIFSGNKVVEAKKHCCSLVPAELTPNLSSGKAVIWFYQERLLSSC